MLGICLGITTLQAGTIEGVLDLEPRIVNKVRTVKSDTISWLPCKFAKPQVGDSSHEWRLANLAIARVDLVYTRYRLSETFDQRDLNRQRLENLQAYFPDWLDNPAIEWGMIEQTGLTDHNKGDNYFHGFRITHRKEFTEADLNAELELLEQMAAELRQTPDPRLANRNRGRNLSHDPFGSDPSAASSPASPSAPRPNQGAPKRSFKLVRIYDPVYGYGYDTIWLNAPPPPAPSRGEYGNNSTQVIDALRNSSWDSILVVVDVTNSMAPYTSQVLQWIKLDLSMGRTLHYTFFTDGDGKPDRKKVIGSTGGIHHSRERLVDPMLATIGRAMKKCKNNDLPENDIEAILAGMKECPECKEIVLVADNYSKMRDYQLLAQINKPVHVIPCGITSGVNIQYLWMARKTQGSIHTPTQHLDDLWKLQEQETVEIGGITYGVVNGKFTVVGW